MNNEIKINVPEGMEIDKENSTFERIKFKPKWVPKRGDITTTGEIGGIEQIIIVDTYIGQHDFVGFNIKPMAVLNIKDNVLTLSLPLVPVLWTKEEASNEKKKIIIDKLNENGYVYDPNDQRVIYKKEKELPKTWIEFCKNNPIKEGEYFVDECSEIVESNPGLRGCTLDANSLPSKECAIAMLALCKLIQLRDCYNDGWKPDWSDKYEKHCIFYNKDNVELFVRNSWSCILVFKSRELRNEFYNNFKDLIEQAKLLL